MRYNKINVQEMMEKLAKEYEQTWRIADEEKAKYGTVSKVTEDKLITIEMEISIIENAV